MTMLAWDTDHFGFPVARIETAGDPDLLSPLLHRAMEAGVTLAYWHTPPASQVPDVLLARYGGRLVDRKVTYVSELASTVDAPPHTGLESYRSEVAAEDVRRLALLSGVHSRFRVDPRLEPRIFETVYDAWIDQSVRREIAEEVLLVRGAGQAIGLVTLGEKQGRGDIGLLAVAEAARGKGVGSTLVRAAQRWARSRGFEVAQVVTQLDNRAACALYEACDYTIETVEHVYHFWFGTPEPTT